MFRVTIDGKGGSYFDSREEAERELRLWGFSPSGGAQWERFDYGSFRVITAIIERA